MARLRARVGKSDTVHDAPIPTDPAVTLYGAAQRIYATARPSTERVRFLKSLCRKANIEVRAVPGDADCIRTSDVERLAVALRNHRDRPRMWPRKKPRRAPI